MHGFNKFINQHVMLLHAYEHTVIVDCTLLCMVKFVFLLFNKIESYIIIILDKFGNANYIN